MAAPPREAEHSEEVIPTKSVPLRRREMLGLLGALGALALPAGASAQNSGRSLQIVATTGMIADVVREVGGARIAVQALMGPGVDPHLYRQTSSDVAAMARADAVLWHGLYLEAQLERLFAELGKRKPVIALAETLPQERLLEDEEYKGRFDPHVWMDPRLWVLVAGAARDALIGLDPAGQDDYRRNAARHIGDIESLATYADRVLASVPEKSRVLISAHDAFGYFGRAYGFEVMGIQGLSTESEAGLKRIEDLVRLIVDRRIGAIFVESSVSERNVQALVEGAAARGHRVAIGGTLYSDAMGTPGTYEGTYIGMIDHNVTAISRALGGSAPLRGLQDKLAGLR